MTFKSYDLRCASDGIDAYAFHASTVADDNVNPTYTQRLTLEDVHESRIVRIPVPSIG